MVPINKCKKGKARNCTHKPFLFCFFSFECRGVHFQRKTILTLPSPVESWHTLSFLYCLANTLSSCRNHSYLYDPSQCVFAFLEAHPRFGYLTSMCLDLEYKARVVAYMCIYYYNADYTFLVSSLLM